MVEAGAVGVLRGGDTACPRGEAALVAEVRASCGDMRRNAFNEGAPHAAEACP